MEKSLAPAKYSMHSKLRVDQQKMNHFGPEQELKSSVILHEHVLLVFH